MFSNTINNPFKYDFIEVSFYEYTIRMTIINNTKMYLVSDLLKQYNKINNTDKRINNWLKRDDTRELLQFCRDKTHASRDACENNEDDFINIPDVIIKIDKFYNNLKAYLVNGAILHDILIWIDKVFAYNVCNFLDNMREINNDRFVEILNSNQEKDKQIELLQNQVDQLKSRYTPEEYSNSLNCMQSIDCWHFCVAYNELTNIVTTVITKDQYQPADKNIKRLYDLVCCNPLILQEKLLDILANDNRFTQISNMEFRTIIDSKNIFWYFKNKCKKLRNELNWKIGIKN